MRMHTALLLEPGQFCRPRYNASGPWRWLAGLGCRNYSSIERLELHLQGDAAVKHKGYRVVVCQHPHTKRVMIDERESHWQDDKGAEPPQDPAGREILEEIMQSLDQEEERVGPGLTVSRIYRILDIS